MEVYSRSNFFWTPEGNISMVRMCAACCEKTQLGSAPCCLNVGFSSSEGTKDLLIISIPLFILFYESSYFPQPCWTSLWISRKSPAPSSPLSHPPSSSGNSTYCRYTIEHAEQESHIWEDTFLSFKTICSLTIACIKFLQYFTIVLYLQEQERIIFTCVRKTLILNRQFQDENVFTKFPEKNSK